MHDNHPENNHEHQPYERDFTTDKKQDPEDERQTFFNYSPEESNRIQADEDRMIAELKELQAQQEAQAERRNNLGYDIPTPKTLAQKCDTDDERNNISVNIGMFTLKTGNRWLQDAKAKPIPRRLLSELWHEGELCILFADTNTGKSILAVQIADSISRGVAIPGLTLEAEAQPVVYMDFELFDKQFQARYSVNYEQEYAFDSRFYRVEVNPDQDVPAADLTMEEYLNDSLDRLIRKTGTKVLVVDNLTYLKNETERAKDALPLMKHLKEMKSKYGLSILALAHTPKRDMSKPMTRNDLQGSKMLINFCDSSFCIGESTQDKSLRYLKQIKARNTEIVYDTKNVMICRVEKPHNFLQFTHTGYSDEQEHLKYPDPADKTFLIQQAKDLKEEGMTYEEIGQELGISKSSAERYVKK